MKATKQSHDWHCHNHDTYGWRGEECKLCKVAPSEVEQLVFRNERLVADYANTKMAETLSSPTSTEALDAYVAEIQAFGNTAKYLLSELLAVLHGDGGHHEDKVGTVQAVEDAMQVFYKRIQQRDLAVSALKQSREALRLPCDRWNKTQFEIVQSAIASIDSAIKESEV